MKQKQIKEYPIPITDAMDMMDAHDICTAEEALDYLTDDRSHGDEYTAVVALELTALLCLDLYISPICTTGPVLADFALRLAVATLIAYIEAEAEIQRARDEVTA